MAKTTNYTGGGMYTDELEESTYIPASEALSTVEQGTVIESTSMGEYDYDISIVSEIVIIDDTAPAVEPVSPIDHADNV